MSEQRKYSISELDRMRDSIGVLRNSCRGSDVEEELRTYMLNGTTPEELDEEVENITCADCGLLKWPSTCPLDDCPQDK